jgi:hypothetical protein
LPTPVGPANRKLPTGVALVAEPGACHLDRRGERVDRGVLPEDHELQVPLQVREDLPVRRRDVLGRDPCDARNHGLDVGDRHRGLPLRSRFQAQGSPCLVHDVDRLVRQVAVVDMTFGELRRRDQRIVRVRDAVVFLEARLEPAQDVDGLGDRGLHHVDFLETPRERVVLLEDAAIFL